MKALVATDGSRNAIDAARAARTLLDPAAELLLVTVIPRHEEAGESAGGFEGPVLSEEEAAEWAAQAVAAGQAALDGTAEALGNAAKLELIESDDAGAEICEVAERVGADVLVIGGSEKGLLRRLFSGSVMHHLVHHAPCPVLVVRHAD